MKLSIIIPYYNCLIYIKELFKVLEPQLNDNIEVIVVDDGCHEKELDKFKAKVIHLDKNSGGASVPRNTGLDIAKGEYIAFIDADDMISEDYIKQILQKIDTEDFDYCYIGWQSPSFSVIIDDNPPNWNMSVWNCIYKKNIIRNERFNPDIIIGEDYDFNVRVRKGKKTSIKKYLYYYNDTPNSLMKRKPR